MDVNGANSGKAPALAPETAPRQTQHHGLVKVQPARLADLQPRYASTIEHDSENPDAHGWYSQMSKYKVDRYISHFDEVA